MRRHLLAVAALAMLAGCGSTHMYDEHLNDLPKTGAATCLTDDQIGAAPSLVVADLDGNGAPDNVQYRAGSGDCARVLFGRADAKRRGVEVTGDGPVRAADAHAVAVPGHKGDLVLLVQQHPRGGFQVRLFGYADGRLAELQVDGKPIFPFVATDVPGAALAASCTDDGFTVTQAVAHQPIGVVPAWDVVRTTYALDGNTVTTQGSEEVADNVLDRQLHRQYADLVSHSLFANCLVAR